MRKRENKQNHLAMGISRIISETIDFIDDERVRRLLLATLHDRIEAAVAKALRFFLQIAILGVGGVWVLVQRNSFVAWALLSATVASLAYIAYFLTKCTKVERERMMLALVLIFGSVISPVSLFGKYCSSSPFKSSFFAIFLPFYLNPRLNPAENARRRVVTSTFSQSLVLKTISLASIL